MTRSVTQKCYTFAIERLGREMCRPKILIVEDETIVALEIKRSLEKLNFLVTNTATSCESALDSINKEKPDLILMDINLNKEKDGIDTVKKIHEKDKIPIIYVTAYVDEKTIKRAIETNPVSYLIKPFKRDELKSNILLGLYKSNKIDGKPNIKHSNIGHNYYFDFSTNNLYYKDLPIKLSAKEALLLKLLIEANKRVVSFEEIEYNLWPTNSVSTSTLRTLVYRLRNKLEYKVIETIPGIGCRLL